MAHRRLDDSLSLLAHRSSPDARRLLPPVFSMTLSADERSAIQARHRVAEGEDDHRADGTDAFHIGCDAARLLAALVAAEADVERLGDGLVQWMEAAKAEEARAKALAEALEGVFVVDDADTGLCWCNVIVLTSPDHEPECAAARAALAAYREATT